MIEEEVFDDYTRTMNFIDFLKRIFFNSMIQEIKQVIFGQNREFWL